MIIQTDICGKLIFTGMIVVVCFSLPQNTCHQLLGLLDVLICLSFYFYFFRLSHLFLQDKIFERIGTMSIVNNGHVHGKKHSFSSIRYFVIDLLNSHFEITLYCEKKICN